MTPTGNDHTCGHPMVVDNTGDLPRCAVCQPSPSWDQRRRTHPHNLGAAA